MIVQRIGYLNKEQVSDLLRLGTLFAIYRTNKKTNVLVKGTKDQTIYLQYPKKDRLPWKTVEGKKIVTGVKIFDSDFTVLDKEMDMSGWNNGNQIMAYEEYHDNY